jgi:hypothetical protein
VTRPLYAFPEEERAAVLASLVGMRVELVHSPLRGQEQSPDVFRGELLAAAVLRSGGYPLVAVVQTGSVSRSTVAIPSAQIRSIVPLPPERELDDPADIAADQLGALAGWQTPPDAGDPAVLRVAYDAARRRLDRLAGTLRISR